MFFLLLTLSHSRRRKPLKRGVKGNFMADKFKTNKMLDVGSVKLISAEDRVGE